MKKVNLLKQKIDEMRQTEIKDSNGNTITVGKLASKEAKSIKVENSAVALIITVLAMRQKWRETAQPRVEAFRAKYPNVKTLRDLKALSESMTEREFCYNVLGVKIKKSPFWRYTMLKEFIEAFSTYQKEKGFSNDWEAIQDWAKNVDIKNLEKDVIFKIKGVNLATVQNLRLLCGVDTVKPDIHVKRALKEIGLGNEVEVVELLSELTGCSSIELDQIFWYWDKTRSDKEEISLNEFKKLPKSKN